LDLYPLGDGLDPQPKLVGTGYVGQSFQGFRVALSADGNTALIGGSGNNNGAGANWVFTRSQGAWSQQGNKLVGAGAVGHALQGWSAALSADGNTAISSGVYDNNSTGAVSVLLVPMEYGPQQGNKLVGSGAAPGTYAGGLDQTRFFLSRRGPPPSAADRTCPLVKPRRPAYRHVWQSWPVKWWR
jgi:hypothetical protein